MTTPSATDILDRHYLEIRCRLLDLGAALDRIERAEGASDVAGDPRLKLIQEGIQIIQSSGTDRAERLQLAFSDAYEEGWNK